jgi:hypothetical protein
MFRIIPLPRGVSRAARQQRALDRIEKTLLADDLPLGSLFAVFTRLTLEDAMPRTERVEAGPRHPLRSAFARRRRPDDRASAASNASGTP